MDQDTQWLYQLLAEVQLDKYYLRVRDGLNITRLEHFAYVKESDLETVGISKPGDPIHPVTPSSTHSISHLVFHLFIHSFIHYLICPFTHSPIRSFIHSLTRFSIHAFFHSSIYSLIHSLIHSSIHSLSDF
jgi:hypothetical protein